MEDMMLMTKRQERSPCSSLGLGIHKDSQRISKVKPKIRIIHIFAPEIIKTDVQNFRELVQRLTGKPTADQHRRIMKKSSRKQQSSSDRDTNKKAEKMVQIHHQVKEEEEEMWNNINNSGGFLSGFSDLDGFIQELDDFSMIGSANQLLAFGSETTQLA